MNESPPAFSNLHDLPAFSTKGGWVDRQDLSDFGKSRTSEEMHAISPQTPHPPHSHPETPSTETVPSTLTCHHSRSKFNDEKCVYCHFTWSYCRKCATKNERKRCPRCKFYKPKEEDKDFDLGKAMAGFFLLVFVMIGLTGFVFSIVSFGATERLEEGQFDLQNEVASLRAQIALYIPDAPAEGRTAPVFFDGQCNSVLPFDALCLSFLDDEKEPLYALVARTDESRVLRAAEHWKLGQRLERRGHTILEWGPSPGGAGIESVDVVFARPFPQKS